MSRIRSAVVWNILFMVTLLCNVLYKNNVKLSYLIYDFTNYPLWKLYHINRVMTQLSLVTAIVAFIGFSLYMIILMNKGDGR